jgi:hypothetical protein
MRLSSIAILLKLRDNLYNDFKHECLGFKKPYRKLRADKVLANVFWGNKGIFFNEFLRKGRSRSGEHCPKLFLKIDK